MTTDMGDRDEDEVVAIIQGLQDAGLAFTVFNKRLSRNRNPYRRLRVCKSSVETNTDNYYETRPHVNRGTSVRDGHYASSYQIAHCRACPTSPPENVPEFPPQRSKPSRKEGNFEVGATYRMWGISSPTRGSRGRCVDRYSDRVSMHTNYSERIAHETFANSLRRYPYSPERSISSEFLQKLLTYTHNKNVPKSTRSQRSANRERSPQISRLKAKPSKNIQTYTRMKREFSTQDCGANTSHDLKLGTNQGRSYTTIRDKYRNKCENIPSKYNYLDYPMSWRHLGRTTEVRYLKRVKKYIRDTILEMCDDNPQVCPKIKSRYSGHRRMHHGEENDPTSSQSYKGQPSVTSSTSPFTHREIPWACPKIKDRYSCHWRMHHRGQDEPSHPYPIFTNAITKDKMCCHCNKPSPCICERKAQRAAETMKQNVTNWLNELPVFIENTPENEQEKERIIKELIDTIRKMPKDENYNANLRKAIESCVEKLPMWHPAKEDESAYRDEIVDSLKDKLYTVKEQTADAVKDIVRKWLDDLPFNEYIDMNKTVNEFASYLSPSLNNVGELKDELRELLKKLPINNKYNVIKNILDHFTNDLAALSGANDASILTEEEFEDEINEFLEGKPDMPDISDQFDKVKNLVKMMKTTQSKPMSKDAKEEEMKNNVSRWIDALPKSIRNQFTPNTKNKFINDLVDKLVSAGSSKAEATASSLQTLNELEDKIWDLLESMGVDLNDVDESTVKKYAYNLNEKKKTDIYDEDVANETINFLDDLDKSGVAMSPRDENEFESKVLDKLKRIQANDRQSNGHRRSSFVTSTPNKGKTPGRGFDASSIYEDDVSRYPIAGPSGRKNAEKQYNDKLSEQIESWVDTLPINFDGKNKKGMIDNLASDIIDRQKYLQIHPNAAKSDAEELEHMKYQVFKELNKMDDIKDHQMALVMDKVKKIMDKIKNVDVPQFNKSSLNGETRLSSAPREQSVGDKTYIPTQDASMFIKENLNGAILDWFKQLPLYDKATPEQKRKFEKVVPEISKAIKKVYDGVDNLDQDIDKLVTDEIRKQMNNLPISSDYKRDDELMTQAAAQLLQYLKDQQMFQDISERENVPYDEYLKQRVDDWANSFSVKDLNSTEKEELKNLIDEFISKLKQAREEKADENILKSEINKFIKKLPLKDSMKRNNEYQERKVEELLKALSILPATAHKIKNVDVPQFNKSSLNGETRLSSATGEQNVGNKTYIPTQDASMFIKENLDGAILDWFKQLPLYDKATLEQKREFEKVVPEISKGIKRVYDGIDNLDQDIDKLVTDVIKKQMNNLPISSEDKRDDEFMTQAATQLLQYLKDQQMFQDISERENVPYDEYLKQRVDDWANSFYVNDLNSAEKEELKNLINEFISKLKQAREDRADEDKLKSEINKFIKKLPLKDSVKRNNEYQEKKLEELLKVLSIVPALTNKNKTKSEENETLSPSDLKKVGNNLNGAILDWMKQQPVYSDKTTELEKLAPVLAENFKAILKNSKGEDKDKVLIDGMTKILKEIPLQSKDSGEATQLVQYLKDLQMLQDTPKTTVDEDLDSFLNNDLNLKKGPWAEKYKLEKLNTELVKELKELKDNNADPETIKKAVQNFLSRLPLSEREKQDSRFLEKTAEDLLESLNTDSLPDVYNFVRKGVMKWIKSLPLERGKNTNDIPQQAIDRLTRRLSDNFIHTDTILIPDTQKIIKEEVKIFSQNIPLDRNKSHDPEKMAKDLFNLIKACSKDKATKQNTTKEKLSITTSTEPLSSNKSGSTEIESLVVDATKEAILTPSEKMPTEALTSNKSGSRRGSTSTEESIRTTTEGMSSNKEAILTPSENMPTEALTSNKSGSRRGSTSTEESVRTTTEGMLSTKEAILTPSEEMSTEALTSSKSGSRRESLSTEESVRTTTEEMSSNKESILTPIETMSTEALASNKSGSRRGSTSTEESVRTTTEGMLSTKEAILTPTKTMSTEALASNKSGSRRGSTSTAESVRTTTEGMPSPKEAILTPEEMPTETFTSTKSGSRRGSTSTEKSVRITSERMPSPKEALLIPSEGRPTEALTSNKSGSRRGSTSTEKSVQTTTEGKSSNKKSMLTPTKANCDQLADPKTGLTHPTLKSAADQLKDRVENWINNLPIKQGTPEEKSKANDLRRNLNSKIITKVGELNRNPEIFNDDFLYEAMVEDEADNIISALSSDDLKSKMSPHKKSLIDIVKEARIKALDEIAGAVYKQQLREAVSDTVPVESLNENEKSSFEVLKEDVADAFISLHYADGDAETKTKLKRNIRDKIDEFSDEYLKNHPNSNIDTNKLNTDLYKALKDIPVPKEEVMGYDIVKIKETINNWIDEGKLFGKQTGVDRLKTKKKISVLAKKIHDIEKLKEINPDLDTDDILIEDIMDWLENMPLVYTDYLEKLASQLIMGLKDAEQSRKALQSDSSGKESSLAKDSSEPKPSKGSTLSKDSSQPRYREKTTRSEYSSEPRPSERSTRSEGSSEPKPSKKSILSKDSSEPRPSERSTLAKDFSEPRPSKGSNLSKDSSNPRSSERSSLAKDSSEPRSSERSALAKDYTEPRPSQRSTLAKDSSQPRSSEKPTLAKDYTKSRSSERSTLAKDYTEPRFSERSTLAKDYTEPRPSEKSYLSKDSSQPRSSERSTLAKDSSEPRTSKGFYPSKDSSQPSSSERSTLAKDYTEPRSSERSTLAKDYTEPRPSERSTLAKDYTEPRPSERSTLAKDYTEPRSSERSTLTKNYTEPRPSKGSNLSKDSSQPRSSEKSTLAKDSFEPKPSERSALAKDHTDPRSSERSPLAKDYTEPRSSKGSNLSKDSSQPRSGEKPTLAKDSFEPRTSERSTLAKDYTEPRPSERSTLAKDSSQPRSSERYTLAKDSFEPRTSERSTISKDYTEPRPSKGSNLTKDPSQPRSSERSTLAKDSFEPRPSERSTLSKDYTEPRSSERSTLAKDYTEPKPSKGSNVYKDSFEPRPSERSTLAKGSSEPRSSVRSTLANDSSQPRIGVSTRIKSPRPTLKYAAKQLNDRVEQWVNNLPIKQGTPQEKSKANDLRRNLNSKIITKVGDLNTNPEIFNDDFLYEAMVEDEADNIISALSSDDLKSKMSPHKKSLIKIVKDARLKALDEMAGVIYKQQLREAVSDTVPVESLNENEKSSFEVLKEDVADAFISLHYADGDAETKTKLKNNIRDKIDEFSDVYLKSHPNSNIDTNKISNDLYKALKDIPVPKQEAMGYDIVKIKEIINNWVDEGKLFGKQTGVDRLKTKKKISVLAKKIRDIEKLKENNPYLDSDDMLMEDIMEWLENMPLVYKDYLEKLASQLIMALKDAEQSRKALQLDSSGKESTLSKDSTEPRPSERSTLAKDYTEPGSSERSALAKDYTKPRPSQGSTLAKDFSEPRSTLAKDYTEPRSSERSTLAKDYTEPRPSERSYPSKDSSQPRSSKRSTLAKDYTEPRPSERSTLAKDYTEPRPSKGSNLSKDSSQPRSSEKSTLAKDSFEPKPSERSVLAKDDTEPRPSERSTLAKDYTEPRPSKGSNLSKDSSQPRSSEKSTLAKDSFEPKPSERSALAKDHIDPRSSERSTPAKDYTEPRPSKGSNLSKDSSQSRSSEKSTLAKDSFEPRTSERSTLAKDYTEPRPSERSTLAKDSSEPRSNKRSTLAKDSSEPRPSERYSLAKDSSEPKPSERSTLSKDYTEPRSSERSNLAKDYTEPRPNKGSTLSKDSTLAKDSSQPRTSERSTLATDSSHPRSSEKSTLAKDYTQPRTSERSTLAKDSSEPRSSERSALPKDFSEPRSSERSALAKDSSQPRTSERSALAKDFSEPRSGKKSTLAKDSSQSGTSERSTLAKDSSEPRSSERSALAKDSSQPIASERSALAKDFSEPRSNKKSTLAKDSSQPGTSERSALPKDFSEPRSSERFALAKDSSQPRTSERSALAKDFSEPRFSKKSTLAKDSSQPGTSERSALPKDFSEPKSSERSALAKDSSQPRTSERSALAKDFSEPRSSKKSTLAKDSSQPGTSERSTLAKDSSEPGSNERPSQASDSSQPRTGSSTRNRWTDPTLKSAADQLADSKTTHRPESSGRPTTAERFTETEFTIVPSPCAPPCAIPPSRLSPEDKEYLRKIRERVTKSMESTPRPSKDAAMSSIPVDHSSQTDLEEETTTSAVQASAPNETVRTDQPEMQTTGSQAEVVPEVIVKEYYWDSVSSEMRPCSPYPPCEICRQPPEVSLPRLCPRASQQAEEPCPIVDEDYDSPPQECPYYFPEFPCSLKCRRAKPYHPNVVPKLTASNRKLAWSREDFYDERREPCFSRKRFCKHKDRMPMPVPCPNMKRRSCRTWRPPPDEFIRRCPKCCGAHCPFPSCLYFKNNFKQ